MWAADVHSTRVKVRGQLCGDAFLLHLYEVCGASILPTEASLQP